MGAVLPPQGQAGAAEDSGSTWSAPQDWQRETILWPESFPLDRKSVV